MNLKAMGICITYICLERSVMELPRQEIDEKIESKMYCHFLKLNDDYDNDIVNANDDTDHIIT